MPFMLSYIAKSRTCLGPTRNLPFRPEKLVVVHRRDELLEFLECLLAKIAPITSGSSVLTMLSGGSGPRLQDAAFFE